MDLREIPEGPFVRHPWEVARARFFRDLLVGESAASHGGRVLDVGAGDGYFAATLAESGAPSSITCWDPGYEERALTRSASFASDRLSFVSVEPAERFDVLVLLDVLEHVDEDGTFLRRLVETRVRRGGQVLASVPAWPALFGSHDRALGHFRRYRPQDFRGLLRRTGLRVRKAGGLFVLPAVARALAISAERVRRVDGDVPATELAWNAGPLVTRAVESVLALESSLSVRAADRGISLPGLSTWALCDA